MPVPTLHSGHIRARIDAHILRLSLARPGKRNALNRAMYLDLGTAIGAAAADPDVRAILIDGEGDMFCAGNDIADFAGIDPQAGDAGVDGPALRFIRALAACDKPIVAAVQGQATGIGTTLLLHVDLVVAAEDARFYTAFIDLALVPEAGSSRLLPALIGRQNAARLLLAGDTLDAEQALRMGLIAYCVPRDELDEHAAALARRLADKSPGAMTASKQLIRHGMAGTGLDDQLAREAERFGERLVSDEVRALMKTFLDRRR